MEQRACALMQGDILSPAAAQALGISLRSKEYLVVITHDCDLPNLDPGTEPHIDVIVAKKATYNPTFGRANHVRKLHCTYPNGLVLELKFSKRIVLDKSNLDVTDPANVFDRLSNPQEKRFLKQWLSARYGRPAFANEIEAYLSQTYFADTEKTPEKVISELFEPVQQKYTGLFLKIEGNETPDVPFEVSVVLVYDTQSCMQDEAGAIAQQLRDILVTAFGQEIGQPPVYLISCAAVSGAHFSIEDMLTYDLWRLNHLSSADNDEGEDQFELACGQNMILSGK